MEGVLRTESLETFELFEGSRCLLRLFQRPVTAVEQVVRVALLRVKFRRTLKQRHRHLVFAQSDIGLAQTVTGLIVIVVPSESLFENRDGCLVVSRAAMDTAHFDQGAGIVRMIVKLELKLCQGIVPATEQSK